MSHRRGLRSRRVSLACYALATSLAWFVATATLAGDAAPNGSQWNVPLVCLLPREEHLDGKQWLPETGNCGTAPFANNRVLQRMGILGADVAPLMSCCNDEAVSELELLPTIPHWAAQLDAETAGLLDVRAPFDFETYIARSRNLLLEPVPAVVEAREFGLDRRDMQPSHLGWEMPRCAELFYLTPRAGAEPTNTLLLMSSKRARPAPPSGSMYLWSFAASATEAADNPGTGTRPSAAAGFVLTRPPGLYSIDWIGVAITAPIH
jgi:hypothetical protein